jgi:proline iminopeptidase
MFSSGDTVWGTGGGGIVAVSTVEHVVVPGATLWTARQGNGPALLVCHGGPGLWDYLGPVAEVVDDLVTVYRFDQRACGRSLGEPPYDVPTALADLEALRVHWGQDAWIVAGHSWGASLALLYCLTYPTRARALIYLAGTGVDPAWHPAYKANQATRLGPDGQRRIDELRARQAHASGAEYAALDREVCTLSWATDFGDQRDAWERARRLFVGDLLPNYEVNRQLVADERQWIAREATPKRLAGLDLPALVVHGEADPRPAWAAEDLARRLPHAELAIMPGVGHLPWLERPDLLKATLRAFVERFAIVS